MYWLKERRSLQISISFVPFSASLNENELTKHEEDLLSSIEFGSGGNTNISTTRPGGGSRMWDLLKKKKWGEAPPFPHLIYFVPVHGGIRISLKRSTAGLVFWKERKNNCGT